MPEAVTGDLAALWRWWARVSDGGPPVLGTLPPPAPGTAPMDALRAGVAAAEAAVDSGATVLVPRSAPRDARAARIVVALLTRAEPAAVLAQPPGMTDRAWIAECTAIRDGLVAVRGLRADPPGLLEALGATGLAWTAGVLLAAAARRTGCLVDGTDESAAALIADRMAFRAKDWWRAGSTSRDPARVAAADRMDLPAGLALDLTDEEQMGARATLAVLSALLDDRATPSRRPDLS